MCDPAEGYITTCSLDTEAAGAQLSEILPRADGRASAHGSEVSPPQRVDEVEETDVRVDAEVEETDVGVDPASIDAEWESPPLHGRRRHATPVHGQHDLSEKLSDGADHSLVLFFSPSCGACQRFHDEWEKTSGGEFTCLQVDCADESNGELARVSNISHFPTLKLMSRYGATVSDDLLRLTGSQRSADRILEKAAQAVRRAAGEGDRESAAL